MPRPRLTEQERQAMRERILDAAEEIAQESGPRAITSRAIAEKTGTSHMVLYNYYESLEEVFQALQLRRVERLKGQLEVLKKRAQVKGADVVLRQALAAVMENIEGHPRMADLPIIMAADRKRQRRGKHPGHRGRGPGRFWHLIRADVMAWGCDMVRLGQEQGSFTLDDPEEMTETAVGLISGIILSWRVGLLAAERVSVLYERVLDIVMNYLAQGVHREGEHLGKECQANDEEIG